MLAVPRLCPFFKPDSLREVFGGPVSVTHFPALEGTPSAQKGAANKMSQTLSLPKMKLL